jgi:hypothetical protein
MKINDLFLFSRDIDEKKGVSQIPSPASAVLRAMEVLNPRGSFKLRSSPAVEKSGLNLRIMASSVRFTANLDVREMNWEK